jgi:aspartyl-tRNA(Asn)/glutamyl-tRNA(Gln) amidotransferase subunit B
MEISDVSISPEALAGMIRLVEEGRLTTKNAKELLPELVDRGGDPEALMLERGLEAVSDGGLIDALVDEVVTAEAEAVELVRAGDDKPLNFLMGKVMKASQGKANPAEVRGRLIERIRGASAGQIES